MEHAAHVGDFFGIEFAHIEHRQCLAAREHPTHVDDVSDI